MNGRLGLEQGVGPHPAERAVGAHLVRAADHGDAVAAVQVAVPLLRGEVRPRGAAADLQRVHQALEDRHRVLGVAAVGEVRADDDAALAPVLQRPLGQRAEVRVADEGLARPAAAHGEDRQPLGAQHGHVAEHVVAVLGADVDDGVARRRRWPAPMIVAHVGEEAAPLGGQQVDDVDALGLALEPRRVRADEVHVRVGRHPARAAPVERAVDLQRQLLLAGPDRHLRAHGRVLEALADLDVEVAHRQLRGELALHVGVAAARPRPRRAP